MLIWLKPQEGVMGVSPSYNSVWVMTTCTYYCLCGGFICNSFIYTWLVARKILLRHALVGEGRGGLGTIKVRRGRTMWYKIWNLVRRGVLSPYKNNTDTFTAKPHYSNYSCNKCRSQWHFKCSYVAPWYPVIFLRTTFGRKIAEQVAAIMSFSGWLMKKW